MDVMLSKERLITMWSRNGKFHFLLRSVLLVGVFSILAAGTAAAGCIQISPTNGTLTFGSFAVGTSSLIQDIVLTNNCGGDVTYSSISISNGAYLLVFGWAPVTKQNKTTQTFGVRFAPTSAGSFNGTFTINVTGQNPIVINMNGSGFITQAAATFSTTSIAFGNQAVGTTSAVQPLTITNTGTAAFTVDSVYADPPFTIIGFSGTATLLNPGDSLPLQVTLTPWQAVAYNGTLVMTSDQLPPKGVTLSGTGIAAKSFAVSIYPTLQYATQGFAYHEQLTVAAGTKPYTWSLASGSTLPSGLILSRQGLISGTLSSSVAVGSYSFTVNVTDSASHNASALLTIPVGAPNKADCGNYFWDVAGRNTPLTALNDLGTGTYLGTIGGLYENGSNIMPASHDTDGVNFANAIQPLDGNGNPDPNGKYAMLSVGMSTAYATFLQFVQDAGAEPTVNPHLVFIPGAMPGAQAKLWADKTFSGWTIINEFLLPQGGVTANQVVAAWVVDTDPGITGTFPSDMTDLQSEFETIAQILHTNFPNLTIAFYGSRFYGGYSNGLPTPTSPEPYAYETAFAVRGMIEDQLNGVPAMNYNPADGPVMAPWVAWADYDWANGLFPRSDGLAWSCQDFAGDGTHNSNPPGREKDTNLMLNFFRTDDATVPWFLSH
jgi:hypothetical protein